VGTEGHDVTADDGSFYSRVLLPGTSYSMVFDRPGRYGYICTPHAGDGMRGEVVVEEAAQAKPRPTGEMPRVMLAFLAPRFAAP
jgi:hypothetical protein